MRLSVNVVTAIAGLVALCVCCAASAQQAMDFDHPPRLSELLPPSVGQNLDINVWGWLSYLGSTDRSDHSYWDADLAAGATQRIGDRMAVSGEMHFYDANDSMRGFLEQAFVSVRLSNSTDALLTVGKFNAGIGLEPRNAWDRFGGTTSLLFGAEPQDALGIMYTQPIGKTGITVRPFVTSGFDGTSDFNGSPAIGATVEYQPRHELSFAITNWFGAGRKQATHNEYAAGEYQGEYQTQEYSSYNSNAYEYLYGNWTGTRLHGERGGSLYFLDATVSWLARPDLTLGAEGLIAIDSSTSGASWGGLMGLVNYDVSDRLRLFGRASFLNDGDGFVTGASGRYYELSAGVGYRILPGAELRGEYRHDFAAREGDLDAFSVHLTFAY
jgi:hypothetical protein